MKGHGKEEGGGDVEGRDGTGRNRNMNWCTKWEVRVGKGK